MRTPVAAALLDAIGVLVFVAIGRSAHSDGVTLAGMASTSWPFLLGAAAGWLAGRAWRQPAALVPAGVVVWVSCVALGMVLRVLAGQGTKAPFIAVALAFLGLVMLGWRLVALFATRRPGRLRARGPVGASGRSGPD